MAVTLIALMTVPNCVFAEDDAARTPPAGFLRRALAHGAAGATQARRDQDAWDVFIQRLHVGSRVRLTLTSGQDVTGTVVEIQVDAVVMNSLDTNGKELHLPTSASRPGGAKAFFRSTVRETHIINSSSSHKMSRGAKAAVIAGVIGGVFLFWVGSATCWTFAEC